MPHRSHNIHGSLSQTASTRDGSTARLSTPYPQSSTNNMEVAVVGFHSRTRQHGSMAPSARGRCEGSSSGAPKFADVSRAAASSNAAPDRLFLVEGDGPFPVDMLRQEQCWPASRRDANAILTAPEAAPSLRQVVLATHNHRAPSIRRWRSKGWMVIV